MSPEEAMSEAFMQNKVFLNISASEIREALSYAGLHLCSEGEGVIGGRRMRLERFADPDGAPLWGAWDGDIEVFESELLGGWAPLFRATPIEETDHG